MRIAFVVRLPGDVERFEPVARRVERAEILLGEGRFTPAVRDSREATRRCARRRGWVPVDDPTVRYDLVVTPANVPARAIARHLVPGGRVVIWRDADVVSPYEHALENAHSSTCVIDPVVAGIGIAARDDAPELDHARVHACGDPRWDAVAHGAAAARAHHFLGSSGTRPVTLVWLGAEGIDARWADALAGLRAESELVLRPTDATWFGRAGHWPRALTGPGLRVVTPDDPIESAELLAAADLVISARSVEAVAAARSGRRVLVIEAEPRAVAGENSSRRILDSLLADRPVCTEPTDLRRRWEEASASPTPECAESMDGAAAERFAAMIARIREDAGASATTSRP